MRLTHFVTIGMFSCLCYGQISTEDIIRRSQQARDQVIEGIKRGIVRVETEVQAGQSVKEGGTGIVLSVSPEGVRILTALHVVKDVKSIHVVFYSDQALKVPATKLDSHSQFLDLAVIEVRSSPAVRLPKDIQPINFSSNVSLEPMTHVWSVNGQWIPVPNTVTKLDHDHDIRHFEYTKVSAGEGYSGGPVFNDFAQVVGIHVDASGGEDSLVAVKIDSVLQTLQALGYNVPKAAPSPFPSLQPTGQTATSEFEKPMKIMQLTVSGAFQAAGTASGPVHIMLLPSGDSTYTAVFSGGGIKATFVNGTAGDNDRVFTFSSLQSEQSRSMRDGRTISGGALSLAISPESKVGLAFGSGSASGSVKLVGNMAVSGQFTGTYSATFAPKQSTRMPPPLPAISQNPDAVGPSSTSGLDRRNRPLPNAVLPSGVSVRDRQQADSAFQRHQYYAAMPVYRQLADAGDSTAMAAIGTMYELGGEGVPKDVRQAAQWHLKAAQAGNSAAMQTVGLDYMSGSGLPQDYGKAAEWLKPAAEAGQTMAMGALGVLYANGRGVPKDLEKAAVWLRKAAATGDEVAKQQLQKLGLRP